MYVLLPLNLLGTKDETPVKHYRKKGIAKAISTGLQISKNTALRQQGFPPRLNHQLTVGNNLFDANENPNIYKSTKPGAQEESF